MTEEIYTPDVTYEGSDVSRTRAIFEALCPESEFLHYVVVDGLPVSKARPRFRKNGHVYSDGKQITAEKYLGHLLKGYFPDPLDGNIAVGCIFFRPTKQRVDVDNLLKHVMDSANKIVWYDDSQVTAQLGILELDRDRPRTVIVIGQHQSTMTRTGIAGNHGVCQQCGSEITTSQPRVPKFCSDICKQLGKKIPLPDPSCTLCGKKLARRGSLYCSECYRAPENKEIRVANQNKSKYNNPIQKRG